MTIAAYPKHHSFKPSGFDWVGDVPEHWDVEKLGSMLTAVSEKNRPDLPLLSITREQGVIERDVEDQDSNHNFIPDDLSGYKVLREGQFGMNKMKAWQGSYGISAHTGIVSPAYFIFDFAREVDPHFFNIAIRSKLYVSYFGSASDGVRVGQWDLNQSRMRQIPILLPPLPEQRAIAAFLDGKCARIDEAVRIKEEQIRLLAERRQILIQQAVTRGLNPNAPMKDSGIDWIGRIPAHWEILKLRNMGGFQNGISEAAEYFGSGHPFITYGDVFNNEVLPQNASGLAKSDSRAQTLYSVRAGDIFFTRTSEITSEIGIASAATSDIPKATFSGFLIRFRPKAGRIVPEYARFLFRSDYVRMFFAHEVNIVTRASLGQELLKNLPVFAPPRDEQARIATWLEGKTKDLDGAIDLKKSQITALREYKTSLINAAVTGKIKVL